MFAVSTCSCRHTWSEPSAAGSAPICPHLLLLLLLPLSPTGKYSLSLDQWTLTAQMPLGVNHAAAGTDGRRLFIFGGRDGGNEVSNGYDAVQIYDTITGDWTTSMAGHVAALPQARGGMGKAVYLDGELFVLGGETATGDGATNGNVYARVDVYNPSTDSWRRAPDMAVARHGVFPVQVDGRVYVAGGGDKAAVSGSRVMEIYDF